jgi:hypothetical protein
MTSAKQSTLALPGTQPVCGPWAVQIPQGLGARGTRPLLRTLGDSLSNELVTPKRKAPSRSQRGLGQSRQLHAPQLAPASPELTGTPEAATCLGMIA